MLYGSERERRLERGPVSECFIISNVAFPEALSKVSEPREPGLETLNPLVTTWSKATLHFLIFALKREPLHGLCVWTQWCFLFNSIFRSHVWKRRVSLPVEGGLDMIRIFLGRPTAKVWQIFSQETLPSQTYLKWMFWRWFDKSFGSAVFQFRGAFNVS